MTQTVRYLHVGSHAKSDAAPHDCRDSFTWSHKARFQAQELIAEWINLIFLFASGPTIVSSSSPSSWL